MGDVAELHASAAEILAGLEVRLICRAERRRWDALMRAHHYLGFTAMVGESLRYVATYQGQWLALLGWCAAALQCRARDAWIGWCGELKWQRLPLLANNARFLILPQLKIPNLASRLLALNLKRLSQDWQTAYGHPLWLVETFVDPRYFTGACYKAAGWLCLGATRGFAKRSRYYQHHGHPKLIFVRPLQEKAAARLADPCFPIPTCGEVKTMRLSLPQAEALWDRLRQVTDPRLKRGIRHKKMAVLAIAICALISGAKSFQAIAEWAKRCNQKMLRRLDCRYHAKKKEYQPPSEPTIRRLLQAVDAVAVDQAIHGWLSGLAQPEEAIAVDGKTLKGARQEGRQIQLLTAFLHQQGLAVAQQVVDSKSNEITAVRPLLEPLDLTGRVVTLDALHTQEHTACFLVEDKHAHYLMTVKDNQKTLKQDIQDLHWTTFPPSIPVRG